MGDSNKNTIIFFNFQKMAGIVIVTGGSRGIGRGITRSLAASGHDIIFSYNKDESAAAENRKFLVEKFNVKCQFIQTDFISKNEESVNQLFDKLGEMDAKNFKGFVHNAGGYYHDFAGKANLEDVQKYSSAYAHTFLLMMEKAKECWPTSKIARKAAIGISSPGCNVSCPPFVSYKMPGVGKAGLEYLVRIYAKELRSDNITVNTVVPGYTKTDAWGPVLASPEVTKLTEDRMAQTTAGGWIEPDEIGTVVDFLASDNSRSITGQCFNVDRGL